MRVALCIPTRGDHDLTEIVESVPADIEIVIWDNSKHTDLSVYGRYAAIELTDAPIIMTQDDDAVLDPESFQTLRDAYQPDALTANMPQEFRHGFYEHHCLIGFGAIFHRDLPARAFDRFFASNSMGSDDPLFLNICDVVFTALVTRHLVDVPKRNLPWCSDPNRMWRQPNHQTSRSHMLKLALQAR